MMDDIKLHHLFLTVAIFMAIAFLCRGCFILFESSNIIQICNGTIEKPDNLLIVNSDYKSEEGQELGYLMSVKCMKTGAMLPYNINIYELKDNTIKHVKEVYATKKQVSESIDTIESYERLQDDSGIRIEGFDDTSYYVSLDTAKDRFLPIIDDILEEFI